MRSGQLKGREAIDRRRVGKPLEVEVTDGGVSWHRRKDRIPAEARLDGIHVIRTSLRTLLDDLGTLTLNRLRLPTPVQERAFGLLGVRPDRNVPTRMTGPMLSHRAGKPFKNRGNGPGKRLRSTMKFRLIV